MINRIGGDRPPDMGRAAESLHGMTETRSLTDITAEYQAAVRKTKIRWGIVLTAWVLWLIFQAVSNWLISRGG